MRETTSSMEVDVRGLPVDEALEVLEQRLDSAYLSGMPFVRIIHGKGTGRLRQAIRRELRDNPYAAGFEPGKDAEGGEGVTVVKLAVG
jgi:DNA mismatch repair protein MutS2